MTRRLRVEAGMATAELAVALPVLVLVLALALSAVRLGVDRVRVVDAAHAGARVLARGESVDAARSAALAAAPASRVVLGTSGGFARAEVSAPPPRLLAAIGITAPSRAVATARLESVAPVGGGP